MGDTTALLHGLEAYDTSLIQYLDRLRTEFEAVSGSWDRLSAVYEGTAANEFRGRWMRTCQRFQEYLEATRALQAVLQERIEALREADQPGGL